MVKNFSFFEITKVDIIENSPHNDIAAGYKFPYDGILGLNYNPQSTREYPYGGVPLAVALKN